MGRTVLIAMRIAGLASAALLLVEHASAGTVKLHGTHSRQEIANACDTAGGSAFGVGGNSGSYGCDTGKGAVYCSSDGKCIGICQACGTRQAGKHGIRDVLIRPHTGIKTSGGNARPKGHHHPVKIGVKPPRHHRHPVNVGGLRAPSAGLKQPDGGHSSGVILRTSHHSASHHR